MAINTSKERLSAAKDLRKEGFLMTIKQATYTGDKRTGESEVHAWAVQTFEGRSRKKEIRQVEIRMAVAALVSPPDGRSFGVVLRLKEGDQLVLDDGTAEVIDPGPISPQRLNGAPDPILYKVVAMVRASA